MKKYISLAAMMSENMGYMYAPSGGKTAKSCTKQQKRRRSVAQKNRKANRFQNWRNEYGMVSSR